MLDETKLNKVKHNASKVIAQCPACYEIGMDQKGDHLCIKPNGKFACVINQGPEGKQHRQRIFELVGIKDKPMSHKNDPIKICPAQRSPPVIIQKNILGHLGHLFPSYPRKTEEICNTNNVNKEVKIPVPDEPTDEEIWENIDPT